MPAERDGVKARRIQGLVVRSAEPDEHDDIARVEAAGRDQLKAVGLDLAALDLGDFHEDLGWDLALVAQVDGAVIGSVRATTDQDWVVVDQLSVDPVWGRQGVGTHLLAELAAAAHDAGFRRLVGTTFAHVAFNAPFYRRLGADIAPDEVLHQRRDVERRLGLDRMGERVVVSCDLDRLSEAPDPGLGLRSGPPR